MASHIPSQLALVDQAQLAVARELLDQILFLVLSLLPVVVTEQMAMPVAAARAAAQSQAQSEAEHLGRATMEVRVTTTEQVMLLAAAAVELVQLVEVPHQAMRATVVQVLQAA